jgi:hypothetical protein
VGYAENGALPLGAYERFRGVAVDETAVLIAYTRTGDANLDGFVNDDDVTIVSATYAPGVPQPDWALGDFDYNGFVDDDDVTLLGAFYNPAEGGGLPAAALQGPEDRNEIAPTVRLGIGFANAVNRSEGPAQGRPRSAGPTDLIHQELALDPGPDGPGYYMPVLRTYETFGLRDVRGPAAGGQAWTRAQQVAIKADGDVVDLLAESIMAKAGFFREGSIDLRRMIRRPAHEAHFFWPQ